ncbi:transcriptional coactivator p15/PC4 family protein [Methylocystis sp. MJC1]|uniref:transcriptional coactivator p15/PC4 family protein n=1 Tax=Methylocystis sp. MJC1 TaxID=2654282 RepID=UPI0013ED37B6|nr:transcriptional coactivator p15/PC4 family protein [Methylocystis sp. MJC1]KAF2990151.1 hypothetical protein MJC1_02811 [Methylocystis sp. MJC1]MBU6527598.1 transcriptional coactivator p15/PC4 family protein [Methylocystis sp. MJC1]UZX10537.1 transcriptional coactivator p15/PC4 family protein [Methylocystis sp. MJC1]
MDPVVIAEWPRNARETLRVSLAEFKGAPTVDLRVWYDDGAGRMKPGRQGVTLSTKQLPRLAEAVAHALAEAEARGLVAPRS